MKLTFKHISMVLVAMLASPDAFAGSYRIWLMGGSAASGGPQAEDDLDLAQKTTTAVPGIGSSVNVTTGGTLEEKVTESTKSSDTGFHFVMPNGFGLGISKSTSTTTKTWHAKTNITAKLDTGTEIAGFAIAGQSLVTQEINTDLTNLDLSYTLPIGSMFFNLGTSLPVAGKAEVDVAYSNTGRSILETLTSSTVVDETLKITGKSGYTLFFNMGFAFGPMDILLGYKTSSSKTEVDLSDSPIKNVLGTDTLESDTTSNSYMGGFGFHF